MEHNNSIKTTGGVSLRYVVMNLKNRMEIFNMVDYKHLEQLVIDAFSQLNIFTLDTIETAYFTIGDTNSILLPSDYIDYTKIGFLDAGNHPWTLTLNKNLMRKSVVECGLPLDRVLGGACAAFPSEFPYPDYGVNFASAFTNGNVVNTQYAMGGGFNAGYYRVDRQGGYLLIKGLPTGTTAFMEYKSTGVSLCGGTIVPRRALETIICKVMLIKSEFNNKWGNPQYWMMRFKQEEALLSNLEYTRTMEEHQDEMWSIWQQGMKR